MTKTFNALSFGSCLLAINERTQSPYSGWRAANGTQEEALLLLPKEAEIANFSELERWTDTNADTLNAILAERGFSSRFGSIPQGRFGALSILDLLAEWLSEGTDVPIKKNGVTYPGFRLTGRDAGVTAVRGKGFKGVAARVQTKNGDIVWFYQSEDVPEDDLEAALQAEVLLGTLSKNGQRTKANLTAPCVSFTESRDLGWVAGLAVPGMAEVESGFQETRFRMNRHGARAQVATGMVARATSIEQPPEEILIDGPFLLVIERPGVETPAFSAYITERSFVDPGSLA